MHGRGPSISHRRSILAATTFALATLALGGCGSHTLETGYAYSPLGSTAIQRRAYYAGPFSPEARAAELSPNSDAAVGPEARRPRPGSQ